MIRISGDISVFWDAPLSAKPKHTNPKIAKPEKLETVIVLIEIMLLVYKIRQVRVNPAFTIHIFLCYHKVIMK